MPLAGLARQEGRQPNDRVRDGETDDGLCLPLRAYEPGLSQKLDVEA